MFSFKANFNVSEDSQVIIAFLAAFNAVICCATSTDWTGVSKSSYTLLMALGRSEFRLKVH